MPTRVRSYSKVNLGLAIGPLRADGFHGLTTMYQTLALHDVVTVSAVRAETTSILLTSNHPWVPPDARNTAWRMVERCLLSLDIAAAVKIRIQKNLPIQGGMGAGSANAAAALLGLERELGVALSGPERLRLAAEIGSDVPLFLVGGAVLGLGRGEEIYPLPDSAETICVVALPDVGVSTPQAFRDWDGLTAGRLNGQDEVLTTPALSDTLQELSCGLASNCADANLPDTLPTPDQKCSGQYGYLELQAKRYIGFPSDLQQDLGESPFLSLARMGNDFERVVFPIHAFLRELKGILMGESSVETPGADLSEPAFYASLSGSGSALFGLYRSIKDAKAAQQRVQAAGCKAVITHTLPRTAYWRTMFAG